MAGLGLLRLASVIKTFLEPEKYFVKLPLRCSTSILGVFFGGFGLFYFKLIPILASLNSHVPCRSVFCEKSIPFVVAGGGTKGGGKANCWLSVSYH